MSTKITNVAVHKASIKLMAGESVSDFTSELSRNLKEHLSSKVTKGTHIWPVEIFADTAVYEMYKYDSESETSSEEYWSIEWSRDKDMFSFGTQTEVQRNVSFKPKPGIAITKKEMGDWVEKSFWGDVV